MGYKRLFFLDTFLEIGRCVSDGDHSEVDEELGDGRGVGGVRLDLDGHGHVVEETTRRTVGRVHGTDEAPGVWQQSSDFGSSHLLEERTPEK